MIWIIQHCPQYNISRKFFYHCKMENGLGAWRISEDIPIRKTFVTWGFYGQDSENIQLSNLIWYYMYRKEYYLIYISARAYIINLCTFPRIVWISANEFLINLIFKTITIMLCRANESSYITQVTSNLPYSLTTGLHVFLSLVDTPSAMILVTIRSFLFPKDC